MHLYGHHACHPADVLHMTAYVRLVPVGRPPPLTLQDLRCSPPDRQVSCASNPQGMQGVILRPHARQRNHRSQGSRRLLPGPHGPSAVTGTERNQRDRRGKIQLTHQLDNKMDGAPPGTHGSRRTLPHTRQHSTLSQLIPLQTAKADLNAVSDRPQCFRQVGPAAEERDVGPPLTVRLVNTRPRFHQHFRRAGQEAKRRDTK